ncbi:MULTISPECIES: hypothetical protein [unclassified Streptomyces]|uniref:hypothetical protein n=1 Tax=unclassified Streptomyces TaxID=2593676 RepID=UPI00131EE95F|nr:hypothetical protein [Streptomyces sp. 303MFCol5.2]
MNQSIEDLNSSPEEDRQAGPTSLLKAVLAQASFIAVLMFYLGATYTNQYYRYFHLSLDSLEFTFPQLALQSLQLVRFPVLLVTLLGMIMLAAPWLKAASPGTTRRDHSRYLVIVAKHSWPAVTLAGLILLILWQQIQPYAWAAPLTIAVGFLLCLVHASELDPPRGLRHKVIPIFVAGICMFWALTQVTRQIAQEDAKSHASNVDSWTGVIILSAKPLSLAPPGVSEEKLPQKDLWLPYRYSGLRLLIENQGRYFVVPHDWKARTDPVYVIHGNDNLWIGLLAGVQSSP